MTGHRLVLLRHAKSSWEGDLDDVDRPLNARGRRDADAAGRWLAQHVGAPDLVLCSIAARTRETWARVSAAGGDALTAAPVRFVDAIYQARPDTLLDQVQALPEATGTTLLVGHAPGLPDLAERLDAGGGPARLGDFTTSAVAVFDLDGPWAETGPRSASLAAFEVPRG